MSKEIGGYFTLELHPQQHYLHDDGIFVNSGRHAIEYVLKTIPHLDTLWIPYYTCRVVVDAINKVGCKIKKYTIDKGLHIAEDISLQDNEYLLYTNYFGLMDAYIHMIHERFKSKLIVDNAQALFSEPIDGVMTAYSPRKTIGVADGGICYTPYPYMGLPLEKDISVERSRYLLDRFDYPSQQGYLSSKESNKTIEDEPLKQMSTLTHSVYSSSDFSFIKKKRLENYQYLSQVLQTNNKYKVPEFENVVCPLIYPLYSEDVGLKEYLISKGVFVATYWPYVIKTCTPDMIEYDLASHLIALPIDQRYGLDEMKYILSVIDQFNKIRK